MKRLLLASSLLMGSLAFHSPAQAQLATVCVNCASLQEELISDAKQAQQYTAQVAQLQTQLNQYANMVTNTVALPSQVFASVQSDINQVRNLANAASLLTGNSGSILTRLQSAQAYAGQASSIPSNIGSQFTMWSQTLGNAGNTLGRTLGVQQGQLSNYTALQAAIQAHSQTAAGQMQAIQAGNELAGLTNTQLQQIQTTLTAAAQEQATHNAIQAERQALADAYITQFMQQPDAPLTGYPRYR